MKYGGYMVVEITRFMFEHHSDPDFVEEAITRIIEAMPNNTQTENLL